MRDSRGTVEFWKKWVMYNEAHLPMMEDRVAKGPNSDYSPQYAYSISTGYFELMLRMYSRGDDISSIFPLFEKVVGAWELAEAMGSRVWDESTQITRHSWKLNLDFYQTCFWMVGVALAGDMEDFLWRRLVALMGNEGQDALLDTVIASRDSQREIGKGLCFPKAYAALLNVTNLSGNEASHALAGYVRGWYSSLKNAGSAEFPPAHRTPHWYDFADRNFEGGAYFGQWCLEAVAVVKAFGIDDETCLEIPEYPGDFVVDGRSPRRYNVADHNAEQGHQIAMGHSTKGWFARLFRSKS